MRMAKISIFLLFVLIYLTLQMDQDELKTFKTTIDQNNQRFQILKEKEIQKEIQKGLKLINSPDEEQQKEGLSTFEGLIRDHQDSIAMYELGMYFRVKRKFNLNK
jgi:hypothetical protein